MECQALCTDNDCDGQEKGKCTKVNRMQFHVQGTMLNSNTLQGDECACVIVMTDIAAITVASQAWIDEQQSLLTLASLSPGPIQYETMGPAPNDGPTSMTITSNAPKSTPKPAAAPSSTSPPGVTNDGQFMVNVLRRCWTV